MGDDARGDRPSMIMADFGDLIAARMRQEHRALAERGFERLVDLLPVDARDVFPTDSLLDHVPALIVELKTGRPSASWLTGLIGLMLTITGSRSPFT